MIVPCLTWNSFASFVPRSSASSPHTRRGVRGGGVWNRNEALNLSTKQMILDFRRHIADLPPLYINSDCVERVQDFTFLGTVISADLSWAANTSTSYLRVLKRNSISAKLLVTSITQSSRASSHTAPQCGSHTAPRMSGRGQHSAGVHQLPPPLGCRHLYIPLLLQS